MCPGSCVPQSSHPLNDNTSVPFGLTPLAPNATWFSGATSLDRRPVVLMNFAETDGSRWTEFNNPESLRSWWRKSGQNQADGTPVADEPTYLIQGTSGSPDQFINLTNQLEKLYTRYGFRRFAFKMPAGEYFGREFFVNGNVSVFGGEDIPFAQWECMPTWKQNQFQDYNGIFQKWRRKHTDATFELYMGSIMLDSGSTLHSHPRSQTYPGSRGSEPGFPPAPTGDSAELRDCTTGFDPVTGLPVSARYWIKKNTQIAPETAFDPRESTHISRMYRTISPWMNIGFKMFWFDAGVTSDCSPTAPDYNRRRYGFEQLATNPYFAGKKISFGAENIPAGEFHSQIECAAGRMAYMEEDSYLFPMGAGGVRHWRFQTHPAWIPDDPAPVTSLHYLVTDALYGNVSPPFELLAPLEQIGEARFRGYVVSPYYSKYNNDLSPNSEEYGLNLVQRWYSQGMIYVADFDGNGIVELKDVTLFVRAFERWQDGTGTQIAVRNAHGGVAVFAMGDVNGDGLIDMDDYLTFMQAFTAADDGNSNTMGPYIKFDSPTGL